MRVLLCLMMSAWADTGSTALNASTAETNQTLRIIIPRRNPRGRLGDSQPKGKDGGAARPGRRGRGEGEELPIPPDDHFSPEPGAARLLRRRHRTWGELVMAALALLLQDAIRDHALEMRAKGGWVEGWIVLFKVVEQVLSLRGRWMLSEVAPDLAPYRPLSLAIGTELEARDCSVLLGIGYHALNHLGFRSQRCNASSYALEPCGELLLDESIWRHVASSLFCNMALQDKSTRRNRSWAHI